MRREVRPDADAPAAASGRRRLAVPPALRYPAYRNYWFGMLAAVGGFQVLTFSQLWLVNELSGSALYLGFTGLANAVPAILLNLAGGVVADRVDPRKLIVLTQTASASLVILLGALTASDVVQVWHVWTIAVFAGAINAFNQPARMALYPHLVDRSVLMSAVALNSSVWQGTRIVAPAIAGMLIGLAGNASAFFLAAAGMLTFAVVVYGLKAPTARPERARRAWGDMPAPDAARSPRQRWISSDLLEGLKFIRGSSVFSFLIGMTFFNSFFAMSYVSLMPLFATDYLHIDASRLGPLMSFGGIGALLMTLWLGARGNFERKGLVLIGGATMTGIAVAAFALTADYVGSYALSAMLLFGLGVFNSMYMISIMSSLQMLVPDQMRGRVMGFYGMTWNIMPLGGMYAGVVASVIGAPFAVAIGGALVSAFALGPALANSNVRDISTLMRRAERA